MYSLYEVEQILRNKQVFVCSLAFLGEGEHSEAFLVNRDIVVKLPKHRQASECLKTEMQVVKGLGTKLNVEIPNVLFQGAFFHEGEEYTYFGSRKLPGHSLNKKQFCALPKPILDKNAEIVANFLYRLHSEKNVLPIQREGDVLVHGDFSLNHLLFECAACWTLETVMWEIIKKIFFTFLTRKTKKNLEQILAGRFSHTIRAYRPVVCKGSFRLCVSEKNPHTRNLPAVSNRNQEVATCTKTKKQGNAPDFRQKQPKAGAFQVLEGKMAVETGCQQVRKDIQGPMEDYTS